MKAHPSLTRQSVRDKGASAMALMIASEFGRAANRSEHRENVIRCYQRARELMGILETVSLPDLASARLKPWYDQATERSLMLEAHLHPAWILSFCNQAASEFNTIATQI